MMKTKNLLTDRKIRHSSPREGLEMFQKVDRSIVMAEFTNLVSDRLWTGYIVQKTKEAHHFIAISQEGCRWVESYTTKTDKQVACTLYTRYLDIDINEIWNIAMAIIEGPCSIEILRRMWELFDEVPIDKEEDIDQNFLLWEEGTDRFSIWDWFDKMCPHCLARDIIDYNPQET